MLHVAQISFFNDPARRSPSELLTAWPTLVDVAEAATLAGVRVSVVQASSHTEHFERNGVSYHFLPFGGAAPTRLHTDQFYALLQSIAAGLFHIHGLNFSRHVLALAERLPGTPLVLQDHASRLPRFWRRSAMRRGMAAAAGIAFCALDQAAPFATTGLIGSQTPLFEVAESTCRFKAGDQEEARRITGVEGHPAILWVGHLDANKDPLTVLAGISMAALRLPELRFYCCFGMAPLLRAVRNRIDADPSLRGRVQLLGRVAHERVEALMRAADVFVLGSHHEGSGYSLIEALACGLPPAVTDIPSFRALTGGGRVGGLWPCGNAPALAEAVQSVWTRSRLGLRDDVRAHYERELSFHALGAKLAAMYENVLTGSRTVFGGVPRQALDAATSSS